MPAEIALIARERAVESLAARIAELHRDDPLAPVTVVVPTGRAARLLMGRLLGAGATGTRDGPSALANVAVVTLSRLAEALGSPALVASGRRALTRTTLVSAVRSVLATQPQTFGPLTTHPATAAEVTERYEELRFSGARLRGGPPEGLSPRARALLELCAMVRAKLEATTFDDADLFASASAALAGAPLGTVVVYLPERARPIEADLLAAVADHGPLQVLIATTCEAEPDGIGAELAASLATRLHLDPPAEPSPVSRAPQLPQRLLLAPNPRAEVREAIRRCLSAVSAGTSPERVALLYTRRDPYLRLLVGALDASGLEFSAPHPDPLASSVAGRLLSSVLEIASGPLRRESIVRLLTSAPLVDGNGAPLPSGEWDRISRILGIVEAAPRTWQVRLDELARASTAVTGAPFDERDDAPGGTDGPVGRDRAAALGLRDFLAELDRNLEEGRRARQWSELASWATGVLDRLLGTPASRASWPERSEASLELVRTVLAELGRLDAIEPSVDLSRFSERVAEELRRPAPRIGRLSNGVIVGSADQLLGVDTELTVLLGCSAANLPGGSPHSPLLEGSDRDELDLEPLAPSAATRRSLRQLGLLAASSATFLATAPALDASGRPVVCSPLVEPVTERALLAGDVASLDELGVGALARDEGELETALLFGAAPTHARDVAAALGLVGVADRMEIVHARDRGDFGSYSGMVGPGADELADLVYSPTSLEQLAACPFRHFLGHVLGCEVLEEPERRVLIDPRDRGVIVHEVLERYVAATFEAPPPNDAAGSTLLFEIATAVIDEFERFGRTGKRVVFEVERRRLLAGLEAARRDDERRRAIDGTRPIAVEHAFGFGAVPPVEVQIGPRRVSFRGKIDRIDEHPDGSLSVIDYKTGRSSTYAGIAEDPVDGGRHLQLPIYALAARAATGRPDASVRASYRFVVDDPGEITVELDEATGAAVNGALEVLIATIDAGTFPMRPGESDFYGHKNCTYCDFNGVCASDRSRTIDAAGSHPVVARYLELTEGPAGLAEGMARGPGAEDGSDLGASGASDE